MINIVLSQQTRARAVILPREHGAWGLLLVPLFTGIAGGITSVDKIPLLALLTVVSLALFCLRTPVESLLGTGVMHARSAAERRTGLLASAVLATISVGCLAGLLWDGSNRGLLILGAVAALALLAQMLVQKLGRRARMAAQLVGAIGLTCTAPAAYYVAAGQLSTRALLLWAANWIFAANQIHYVQVRIHSARAGAFREKFAQGGMFFSVQVLLLIGLALGAGLRLFHRIPDDVPALLILAFLPALARGIYWFVRRFEPLDVKSLGWSEMKHGVAFGLLLALSFLR